MLYKDSISLLAEAAAVDLNNSVEQQIDKSQILSQYSKLEEVSEDVNYAAEFVPVMRIDNEYYTEMQYLAPYMQNNEIRSVAEALDSIAVANKLPVRSVGLLIESQECVTDKINEALGKGKKSGASTLNKVRKGENLVDKLLGKGYKIKKKKSKKASSKKKGNSKKECGDDPATDLTENKKACPKCGKYPCECTQVKKESMLFGFNMSFM